MNLIAPVLFLLMDALPLVPDFAPVALMLAPVAPVALMLAPVAPVALVAPVAPVAPVALGHVLVLILEVHIKGVNFN
jgi:hypothetical protein